MNVEPGETGVNPYIFRAYDIRGVVGSDLTPGIAELIGRAFGTFVRESKGGHVVVGRDNRISSPDLSNGLIKGLIDCGIRVTDIGLATSPLLYFAAIQWKVDGGISVTASHLPPEYNGFKLVGQGGVALSPADIAHLKDTINSRRYDSGHGSHEMGDPVSEYKDRFDALPKVLRPIHAVVDTGNGVAGLFAPSLLRSSGCRVTELHCDLDGTFPNHIPNPELEQNVKDLEQKVVEVQADIGLALDGDGDRLGIVNEKGEKYQADMATILLARDFLTRHPGARIIVDIKSSSNLITDIKKRGGEPVLWKSGHSLIERKMIEEGILLAGELSGHMFTAEGYYPIDDALYAACRIVHIISRTPLRLSEHFADLPRLYSTPVLEFHCPDSQKFGIVKQLTSRFQEDHEVITIDGARIDFGDGWGLIRASNTNPALSVRCEASTPRRLEEIRLTIVDALREYPSVDLSGQ